MQKSYRWLKTVFAVIVVALLVAYAFISFLPHGHGRMDSDCAVCNMADSSREILLAVVLLFMAWLLPKSPFISCGARERVMTLVEGTPVELKVKLSH